MKKHLIVFFACALILRLLLVFSAYHGDLNNNISWGTIAYKNGLSGFYGLPDANDWPYSAPNQPPLTILMFAGTRMVWQLIENVSWKLNGSFQMFPSQFIWFWEEKGMFLLVKLPSILADLGIGYLIYRYIVHKRKDRKLALILAAAWLFNPITWYNSAVWGQTDSIVNLLGFAAILSLLKKNLIKFSVLFVLSFLFKGSLGIFIPILGLVAIWQKQSKDNWIKAVVCGLLVVVAVCVWFHPHTDLFLWLVELYKNRILPGEIGDLTANAFNFWWLVDSGKVLDSTVFYGFPARAWGFILALIGIGRIVYWLGKKITDKKVFASLAFVSVVSFLFMTRIHPRYLYPFFLPATLLLGAVPNLVIPYIILSLTHLLNLYYLFWAPPFQSLELLYLSPSFMQTISIINILVFVYFLRQLRSSKI